MKNNYQEDAAVEPPATSILSKKGFVAEVLLLFFLLTLFPALHSQSVCGPNVPTFTVDLTGNPNGSWISPNVQRNDQCCSATAPEQCVQFIVTLDPASQGIIFDIYSGSVPPGALFYQINCGPPTPVGQPICLIGVGPHIITFCKPGNNTNQYIITSIASPSVSGNIIVDNGCSGIISASGFTESTITWNSVYPGVPGEYNPYLSCTAGCDTVTVTGQPGAPPYVDYQVCGTPIGGCAPSTCDTVRVYINSTLVTNIQPQNPTVCFGNPGTTITAVTNGGTAPYTYSWSTGATTSSIFVPAGTYTVNVHDGTNCPAASATVTVTSFTATITANAGNDIHVCASSPTAQLNGSVTGVTTGQWSGGNGNYAPNNTTLNATYTPSAAEISAGQVTLTLITTNNGTCPPDTDQVTIFIHQFNAALNTVSSSPLCFGQTNGSASVAVSGGNGPFVYSWNTNPSQSNSTAANIGAGSYTVTVTDTYGCSGTSSVTVTQPTALALNASGFAANCFNSCDGQAVVIPSGATPPYSFSWTSGCTAAGCQNLCAGTYTVLVTDHNGCALSDTAIVVQPAALTLTTSAVAAHCSHNDGSASATVTGGSPGYSYSWSPGNQSTQNITGVASSNYTVTITDAHGCHTTGTTNVANLPGVSSVISGFTNATCPGSCNGTATVSASGGNGPYQYSWQLTPPQSTASASGLCASPTPYHVVVTDANGCTDTSSVSISQPQPFSISVTTPPWLCIGQSTTLAANASGGTQPYTYNWSSGNATVSPQSTTSYSVTVTDANGCVSTAQTVTVNVYPPLSVTATNGAVSCIGHTVTLTATASGGNGGPYSYAWVPSSSSSTGSSIVVSPATSTTYTVDATDNCTVQHATAHAPVYVPPTPQVAFTSASPAGCQNMCTQFTSNVPSYDHSNWYFGDGGTSALPDPNHCYNYAGSFGVTLDVTDTNGCTYSFVQPNMITVHPNPIADFTLGPQPTTILDPHICFTDRSTNDVTQWYWNFGDPNDLTTDSIANPCHTYSDTGRYCADLIVHNSYGCWSTVEYCLEIQPYYTIYIPNAFTPNGDGLNDVFLPSMYNVDAASFSMSIFDRWGNNIFNSSDLNKGWDGRVNSGSNIVPQGVYVWKISVKDYTGALHNMIGHVSVIR